MALDESAPWKGSMSTRRTRPLSLEGSREVYEEMARPPEDTPERRATFKLADEMAEVRRRSKLSDTLLPLVK
ncbi:hypothetical protein SAMN05216486_10118 [bacterium JGI 053]|nr:hypothetical protein SAMN05216486_10118 [bacterium JGI 053]